MGKTEDTVTEATELPKVEGPRSKSTLLVDQMVDGRYAVKRFIAKGGNCEVYEVEDGLVRERVALKILRPRAARDEDTNERFRREIQIARKVTHRNVCRIYDAGVHGGVPFFTMELLSGETLAKRLAREGRMKSEVAVPIVRQVCAGMAAAHKAGIVHRDLKASNVMLEPAPDEDGGVRVVVTDFGVARAFGMDLGTFATGTGIIIGTPAYMSPEQIEGGDITPAADIYALGVVLYEMVTGQLPFAAGTPLATAELRLKQPPATPRAHVPDLNPAWELTILRCLKRAPSARFAEISEIPEALEMVDDSPTLVGEDALPIPELPPPDYPPDPVEDVIVGPKIEQAKEVAGEVQLEQLPTTPQPKLPSIDLAKDLPFDTPPGSEPTWIAYTAAVAAILIGGWLILQPQPTAWDGQLIAPQLSITAPTPVEDPIPAPAPAPAPAPVPAPAPARAPVAAPAPVVAPPSAKPKLVRVTPAPTPAPPAEPSPQFSTYLDEAKAAYSARNYVKAVYRAEYALREKPGDQEALGIAGMAGCHMKNRDIAAKYLRQLKGQRLTLVRQICLTNKVPLPD